MQKMKVYSVILGLYPQNNTFWDVNHC